MEQLATEYQKSSKWIRGQLDQVKISRPKIRACPVVIVADMTFVKRIFGVAVVRAPCLKKNLAWQTSAKENASIYRELRWQLWTQGFELQAAVIDGRPGLLEVFWDVPVQMCHFHQIQIMTRYLTTRPNLPAGQALRQIALSLPKSNRERLQAMLATWHARWGNFLKEKSYNLETKRWFYTHRRLRSAYRSITRNLPILYTYQKYPELHIPNTTNSLLTFNT